MTTIYDMLQRLAVGYHTELTLPYWPGPKYLERWQELGFIRAGNGFVPGA